MKTTLRELIREEIDAQKETWDDVITSTIRDDQLDVSFSAIGGDEGSPFTVWTSRRVYFLVHSSGCPGCESVPRHPCEGLCLRRPPRLRSRDFVSKIRLGAFFGLATTVAMSRASHALCASPIYRTGPDPEKLRN